MSKINKIIDKSNPSNETKNCLYERYKDSFGKVQVITEKTTFLNLYKSNLISTGLYSCLDDNGCVVLGDILKMDSQDIRRFRRFGQGRRRELHNFFKYNMEHIEIAPNFNYPAYNS